MGHQNCDWYAAKQMLGENSSQLMGSINAYKSKCGKSGTSKFALKLQKEEAVILSKVAEKCAPLDIPCVPIFDGMLVPSDVAEIVKGFFIEVLTEQLGFAPEPTIETAGDEVYPDVCVNL